MKSKIRISDNFTYGKLLRFTLPSIVMNIFLSLYIVVDGFFVANFVGKTEFAAVNLILPVLNIMGEIGYMFGVGGSALIAKTMGEKNQERANRLFSLIGPGLAQKEVFLKTACCTDGSLFWLCLHGYCRMRSSFSLSLLKNRGWGFWSRYSQECVI